MLKFLRTTALRFFSIALLGSSVTVAGETDFFEVTVTNLTRGQAFTPILVASHRNKAFSLFTPGGPASVELAALAEAGDTGPLTQLLQANRRVIDVAQSGALLDPGHSVTVTVSAHKGAKRITLASMLIPTNDSFIALNSVKAPKTGKSVTYWSPGYDAGSEPNDELCVNIPGPVCGGRGGSPDVAGEGYVHISGGIQGIGIADLLPELYDWRNPVAKITVKLKG